MQYSPVNYYRLGTIWPRRKLRDVWRGRERIRFIPGVLAVPAPGGQGTPRVYAKAVYVPGAQESADYVPGGQGKAAYVPGVSEKNVGS